MSQSALIAFENSNGTFDLYWSHNGADEFHLKPHLEEVVSGERSRTLPNVKPKLPDGIDANQYEIADTLKTAVVPQPVRKQVPRRMLGDNIDFLAYEGFYLVTEENVELYYPMWTYPGVLIALREMFELEVFDRSQFENTSGTDFDEPTPVETFRTDDYSLDRFEDVRYRSFLDLHHLGIFQTISGTVNNASDKSDLHQKSLVKEEHVNIIPKTSKNIFEPYRVGNGVLINVPWDENDISQRLNSITNRAASLRIDMSLRLLKESKGTPTRDQYEEFGRELVEHACRNFGMMIYPSPIQPFTKLIEEISETRTPNERLRGDRYRIIDIDRTTALFKPTEQYGKTGVVKPSRLSADDVQIVDLEKTAENFLGVTTHIENGDIVFADIDDSTTPSRIQSIQLFQRIPLEMVNVDTVPQFIEELYRDEVELNRDQDSLPSVRTHLTSEYETISESELKIGEVQVTHDPEDEIWKGLAFGEISEQVYGRFEFTSGQPQEVILCNPTSEPFWFGFFFETPMSGFARHWRRKFECEYEIDN